MILDKLNYQEVERRLREDRMRRLCISFFLLIWMITGCTEENPAANEREKEKKPSPPTIQVVREESKKVPLKTYIRCWNEPCSEEGWIPDAKEAPITLAKPQSDIRISFPSNQTPYDLTLIQRDSFQVRAAEQARILELSGPEKPGTYLYELHATWRNKEKDSGYILYTFRVQVEP